MNRKTLILPTSLFLVLAGCTAREKTISVQLPTVDKAVSIPDADQPDSLVLTVTKEGKTFLGSDATSLDALKDRARASAVKKAYLRADTHAPYRVVAGAVDELRLGGITELALLTRPEQSGKASGGSTAVGLGVTAADRPDHGQRTLVVQAFKRFEGFGLKINQEDAVPLNLESRLNDILRDRANKDVFVKADGELTFGDVAQVIDMGLSAGARVIVVVAKTEIGGGAGAPNEAVRSILLAPSTVVPKVAAPQFVRVSEGVESGLLVRRVQPTYPSLARQAHIKGAVILQARISKEGNVETLRLITGHPMLAPAATGAVKQWKYKPYLLNGEPVEVETMVTVSF